MGKRAKLDAEAPAVIPRRRPSLTPFVTIAILILVGVVVVPPVIRATKYRPSSTELAIRETRAAKQNELLEKAGQAFWYVCGGSLLIAASIGAVAFRQAVRFTKAVIAQKEEIHARNGVFPVVVRKTWDWKQVGRRLFLPTQTIAVVDLNKNPAPVLRIGRGKEDTHFELPESIPPDQRAVTHGAQVVQAASASGGAADPGLGTFLDRVPEIPAGLLTGDLPQIELLENGHVNRLLDEAGLLDPDQHLPQ